LIDAGGIDKINMEIEIEEILELDKFDILDPNLQSAEAADFERFLSGKVIGQDQALKALSEIFQVYRAGIAASGRPIGALLFLGPTGTGKTKTVEAAAEVVFGTNAVIKIDCAEFQHPHEIAKLKGSPPGYLGHRETSPMLTQENLDRCHNDQNKLTFLLFDEIEKASDSLWNLLLAILDKGSLTLGDNRKVDFSRTIIIMTSNLGAREMQTLTSKKMGFISAQKEACTAEKIDQIALTAARKHFSPEFMNRIDKIAVFQTLSRQSMRKILLLELANVQARLLQSAQEKFHLQFSSDALALILNQGINTQYNARPLKRAVEKLVVLPLANMLSSSQLQTGDLIVVDSVTNKGLIFKRKREERAKADGANLLEQLITEIMKAKPATA